MNLVHSIGVGDQTDRLGPGAMAIAHSLKTKALNSPAVTIEEHVHTKRRRAVKLLQEDKQ